jgi:hypothetical protein
MHKKEIKKREDKLEEYYLPGNSKEWEKDLGLRYSGGLPKVRNLNLYPFLCPDVSPASEFPLRIGVKKTSHYLLLVVWLSLLVFFGCRIVILFREEIASKTPWAILVTFGMSLLGAFFSVRALLSKKQILVIDKDELIIEKESFPWSSIISIYILELYVEGRETHSLILHREAEKKPFVYPLENLSLSWEKIALSIDVCLKKYKSGKRI